MMFKRIAAVAATTVMAVAGLAGVASANDDTDTFWHQHSQGLRCDTPVTGHDGGVVRLHVSGDETRKQGHGFVANDFDTQMWVEKWVSGSWRFYAASVDRTGYLGPASPIKGGYQRAKFTWNDSPSHPLNPIFSVPVQTSGQYRAFIGTVVYDQDGFDVAHLTTTVGATCTFRGKV
jgi:hypothetical protein